ncbi:MAG TPA: CBS domain-containing protein [Anaerolineales bacterium]|nr:CBS domain-containing protein [Anaerolineales bacterium]
MTTLILTHEQADFDAVASAWAAHRLQPAATPVLPRRINRNVRAFLTLYGNHFNFTHTEDLPRRHVERVTVVDAQSVSSVKGMTPKTEITVIDHHDSATLTVGANTTLLAERLADSGLSISPIEATLFLLGIYEDTGALTYLTTTPRDARAAAFLLEAGAQLDTVREFLQHPLTGGQAALFDQLVAAVETHVINGQPIIITAIDGGNTDEELSSLAHKLRDTFDAPAILMLVALGGHEPRVQLIARSTSSNVDVGALAARFGGGGHNRAAAAILRDQTLAEAKAALLAALPDCVRPPVTVAEIMSRSAQTLEPATTVREAAERMKRYGYEGYPVVSEGRVLGLVTRRAVDRAQHHHLDAQPISTIMDAGEVIVSPADSIEHLQRVMTSYGWGQIPVAENGNIVGIVTRTDLLKRLAAPPRAKLRRNLADQLAAALPKERLHLLHRVSHVAASLNVSLFIVGGFVRDLFLDLPSADFDLVVEGDATVLARRVAAELGGRVTVHQRFGTAKWFIPAQLLITNYSTSSSSQRSSLISNLQSLDFVSARTEFYAHPSALPEVEHASIKLDLHRRDFTLNTLALCLDRDNFGDVLDFWGGERDLRDGLIRVLHSISFVDDPTRILRAVRFEQRFNFLIEDRTLELLTHARPLLHRVSGDRLRHELDYTLQEPEPERQLARLSALGILEHIHPDLAANGILPRHFAAIRNTEYAIRDTHHALWSAWLSSHPIAALDDILARLAFPARHADFIKQVAALRIAFAEFTPKTSGSTLHARLSAFDPEPLRIAIALCADEALRTRLLDYEHRLRNCKPATTGDDLIALGLRPGPRFGEILSQLQAAYLDGEIGTAEDEKHLLSRILERG